LLDIDFKKHAIWATIEGLENTLVAFALEKKTDPKFSEYVEKLGYLRWVLESSNSSYFSPSELTQLNAELQQIKNHTADNFGHYPTIETWYSNIFTRMPYPRLKKIFRSEANDAIESFTATVSTIRAELDEALKSSNARLEANRADLLEVNEQTKAVQKDVVTLEATLATHVSRLEAEVDAAATAKISEIMSTFSTDQDTRRSEFQILEDQIEAALKKTNAETDALVIENTKTIERLEKALESERAKFTEKANSIVDDLSGLYEAAGQTALAAGFAGSAEAERKSFELYSWIAIGIFGLSAIVMGILWYVLAKQPDFKFIELLQRVPVAAVFLVPGFYVASLGNRHRKSAVKLRSLSLRIKAFDAFVANLDEPKRVELRTAMMKEFFEEKFDDEKSNTPMFGFGGKQFDSLIGILEKSIEKLGGGKV
jgi:hypothetical protein